MVLAMVHVESAVYRRHCTDSNSGQIRVHTSGKTATILKSSQSGWMTISQPQYVNSILRKYKMEDANPVSTPRSNDYASLMGSLQYLAIATRPDIAYAVNRLAAYTANPSFEHYTA